MFLRLLYESFVRQRRRKALAGVAILLGTTAVTAMLALATTIGDRIHRELAVYGANIVVFPQADQLEVKVGGVDLKPSTGGAYLKESSLDKLKTIFWANNITGLSPELPFTLQLAGQSVPATGLWFHHPFGNGSALTGAPELHPSWKLTGAWPAADNEAVLGHELAAKLNLHPGDTFTSAQTTYKITGIADTAGPEDSQILLPLAAAQTLSGHPDAISRVEISAKTRPEDAFARKDPDTLPAAQREIWYCRPYANSIAYQVREAIPGAQAEQVRRVEQSEGSLLEKIGGLMWLVSAAALLAAGFAVSAAMATAILERRGEIGLMRSLGASRGAIALLFYSETGLLAVFAGALGYLAGSTLAWWLGARIFAGDAGGATGPVLNPVLLPVVVAMALIVAIAGSTPSIRAALRMDPTAILRADA
ncbi:FtsX-like permease family protein [Granulicella sp. WH15]|uniref:ABC transporter permease n=1 Tax=Granulicella sp. WH15 TaxID=2602070 RepID=UPI00136713B8|nr:ABC transporter permease [Granulicella sp. WH15]QHN03368.1 FtsX-like permease family protein [Granulicella sp. WH15]